MKSSKKWLLLASAALIVLTSACSKNDSKDGADTNTGATGDKGEKVTIELFNQKSEIKDNLKKIIDDFQKENPNIIVNQVQVPDSRKVLYARMSTNDVPDIMSIFPNESDFQSQAKSGYFMDLTGSDVLANVNPSFLKDIKYEDKDFSVPLTMNAYGIYYNVNKFNELGLTVPTTWAELEKTAAAIKEKGLIPFATSFKAEWSAGHLTETLMANGAGVEAANKFFADAAAKAESDPGFQKLIQQMDFIRDNSQPDAAGADYPDAVNLFAKGEALMMPQGIWAVPMIEQAGMEDEYKMFPVPNEDGKGIVLGGVDYALAISAKTEHPEEAKKFVKYMTEKSTAQYLADNEKSPSTIDGVKANAPQTEDVTKLLAEEGRYYPWLHFNWAAGKDASWGAQASAYFIIKAKPEFEKAINKEFEK